MTSLLKAQSIFAEQKQSYKRPVRPVRLNGRRATEDTLIETPLYKSATCHASGAFSGSLNWPN